MGKKASTSGNFFKFVKLIQSEEFFKSNDLETHIESLDNGEPIRKKRKVVDELRQKKIDILTTKLENKDLSLHSFLDLLADASKDDDDLIMFEKAQHDYESSTDEEDNESASENDQQELVGKCIICLDRLSNILYLPCRHLKICTECNANCETVAASEHSVLKCAYCRAIVDDHMTIFA